MRILRCHIESFGRLSNADYSFDDGLNIINEKNGTGKSTLAAFIRVMLFGFANEGKRSELENERKRFKPWQGGVYGGSLVFSVQGKNYRVNRVFGTKEKDDEFSLVDADTLTASHDFSTKLGEEIFKLDHESFNRTVYIAQGSCETGTTDSINAKLGNLADNTDDINNYETVNKKLTDKLNALSATRKTGALSKLKYEISSLEDDIRRGVVLEAAGRELHDKRSAKRARLELLKKEQTDIRAKITEVSAYKEASGGRSRHNDLIKHCEDRKNAYESSCGYFNGVVPVMSDIEAAIKEADRIAEYKKTMEIYQQTINELELKNADIEIKNKKLIFMAVFALIAAVIFGVLGQYIICGICAVVFISVTLTGVLTTGKKHGEGEAGALDRAQREYGQARMACDSCVSHVQRFIASLGLEVSDDMRAQLQDIRDRRRAFDFCKTEYDRAYAELEAFEKSSVDALNDASLNALSEELGRVTEELGIVSRNISEYTLQIDRNAAETDALNEARERLENARERYKSLEHSLLVARLTHKYLDSAKTSFTARYMKPVRDGFYRYYNILSSCSDDKYEIDANMEISLEEAGMPRNLKSLSCGYQDMAAICMRMSLVNAMYEDEKPFLIFDDPFVNLDDDRIRGGMAFLREAAKEYQIIYFTCHGSRV